MNKSEMLGNAKDRIRKQVERIKAGEVVCEKTSPEGDKVVVTKTTARDENGNDMPVYGYMIYYPYTDEPFCYIESTELFTDFEKKTSIEGNALPYTGYQSVITRNLTGTFSEYVHDRNFDMYNVYFKNKPSDKVKMTSSVHGFMDKTDPVQLIHIDFMTGEIYRAAGVHTNRENKVSVDYGGIKTDGTLDVEEMVHNIADEMQAEAFLTGDGNGLSRKQREEKAREVVKSRIEAFNDMRKLMGSTEVIGIEEDDEPSL